MKPTTRLQKEVFELHKKLPKIPGRYISWAYRKLFKHYAWKTKHKASCFECGHSWSLDTSLITKLFPIECPSCGKKLEVCETRHHTKAEIEYFQVLQTVGDYQIQRMFQIRHCCRKGYKAHYSCDELFQHWLRSDGKLTTVSLAVNAMGLNYSGHAKWLTHYPMEIKHSDNDRYYILSEVYPVMQILPIMYRNGFNGSFHEFNPIWFFELLLKNNKFETLLKVGQYQLMKYSSQMRNDYIYTRWGQIKTATKHKFYVEDPSDWFDYLNLLDEFKMDSKNPKLICPDNFKVAHDRLVARKRAENEREREAERKKREFNDLLLRRVKKHMLGIVICEDPIKIVPLRTVKDFKAEEKALNHCVYSSRYHKKDTSLILSAQVNDVRTETIELSLDNLAILQCRGYNNNDSQFHSEIIDLLRKNMPAIKSKYQKSLNAVKSKIKKQYKAA